MNIFSQIPDDANVWFHCVDRTLTQEEASEVKARLSSFVTGWQSHGRPVIGDVAILGDRIIAIAGVIPDGDISGCGIDSVTRELYSIASSIGVNFTPALDVVFSKADGHISTLSRIDFRHRLTTGDVEYDILDVSVSKLADVRAGKFKVPLHKSWFSRYLPTEAN